MRRITIWALSTISALVLLFSYHTSTSATAAGVVALGDAEAGAGAATGASHGSTGSSGTTSSTPGETSGGSPGSSDAGSGDGTYTGQAVMTRYGAVQVEITVRGGRITESTVTQVPWSNGQDQQINSYAVPILNDETVQAQGSDIDMVSGATYTSQGYLASLQSAIDQANL